MKHISVADSTNTENKRLVGASFFMGAKSENRLTEKEKFAVSLEIEFNSASHEFLTLLSFNLRDCDRFNLLLLHPQLIKSS